MQKNIKKKIVDIPIEKNLNVGDIVYTKSCMCSGNEGVKPELSSVVLDVGLIKNVDPLDIYARATIYDAYNLVPSLYVRVYRRRRKVHCMYRSSLTIREGISESA